MRKWFIRKNCEKNFNFYLFVSDYSFDCFIKIIFKKLNVIKISSCDEDVCGNFVVIDEKQNN